MGETVQLARFALCTDRLVAEGAAERFVGGTSALLDIEREATLRAYRIHVRAFFTRTMPDVAEESFPDDWWQAVKDRWFPAWAKRRWPVRRRIVRMERFGAYPEIPWEGGLVKPIAMLNVARWTEADEP
jgi:hypothetical protein